MARTKHTTIINGPARAAQKQLNLIKNLKTRMKEKYGVKSTAIKRKGYTVGGAKPPAAAAASSSGEKRKHRWRSGTVAKREIRKMTRTVHPLFPKSTFSRLVREVCQVKVPHGHDMRFTTNALKAIQEASENYIVETFHKSDMARIHAGRETLSVNDIRFSRFMKPESMWVMTDRLHEKNFFGTVPLANTANSSTAATKANPAKLKLMQEEAAFGTDVVALEKKLKLKKAAAAAAAESKKRKNNNEAAESSALEEDAAAAATACAAIIVEEEQQQEEQEEHPAASKKKKSSSKMHNSKKHSSSSGSGGKEEAAEAEGGEEEEEEEGS